MSNVVQINQNTATHQETPPSYVEDQLAIAINIAKKNLLTQQHPDGYWCMELEADCTIPAEYILSMHYLEEIDDTLQSKLVNYIKAKQCANGGWPLFYGGDIDLSCSVKCYFALKLAGEKTESSYMMKAREAVLKNGGAAKSNVFTRLKLALFNQVPWRGVPFLPVEVLLMPKWFPFHLSKVSYWSRTVMVPLLVLCTLKKPAKNPTGCNIDELFAVSPELEKNYFPQRSFLHWIFLKLDKMGKAIEWLIPKFVRKLALTRAEQWVTERLNGEDGLGAIFPAMVNAYEMYTVLGYAWDHPYRTQSRKALQNLLTHFAGYSYCQPCFSPIWDSGLLCLALQEMNDTACHKAVKKACHWLQSKQLLVEPGDWRDENPNLLGGGWAFQYNNPHYPDLDDTAVIARVFHQQPEAAEYEFNIHRALDWLVGMQSKNGGFAAFDKDNTYYYLNEIPFADHGALLDPPTCDVSGRCLAILSIAGRAQDKPAISRCLNYLRKEQEPNGSWFGRWGTNYIYGTWAVLEGLIHAGEPIDAPYIRKAIGWLKRQQHTDGGWGEDNGSYYMPQRGDCFEQSTSFQTAMALLTLIVAGEQQSQSVKRGIQYLLHTQTKQGSWEEPWFNAPGFPRVFYLKYHGYSMYLPLWALARYRNAIKDSI